MNENNPANPGPCSAPGAENPSRRRFFALLCISLGGLCAAIMTVPLVGFIIAPFFRRRPERWVTVGKVDDFKIGTTVSVPYPDPSPLPWAGVTAKSAAWLRRAGPDKFIAFSVHCTHMGCPVRWLPDARLFMCPCHGGVFYEDGTVAAGPPPGPLTQYDVRITNGKVEMKSVPTPITTRL